MIKKETMNENKQKCPPKLIIFSHSGYSINIFGGTNSFHTNARQKKF